MTATAPRTAKIRRATVVLVATCLFAAIMPSPAGAVILTNQGRTTGTYNMSDPGCYCPDAWVDYVAYLNVDTDNHRMRPYGTVEQQNPRFVSSDMRLFKNGYAVTHQRWTSDIGYLRGVYTPTYDCGGYHGFRSYNTWSANHAYTYVWGGTLYSDLVYGC